MTNDEIHTGIIRLNLDCDSDTSDFGSGYYLDVPRWAHFVKEFNLKPGDRVKYKLINGEPEIIKKI